MYNETKRHKVDFVVRLQRPHLFKQRKSLYNTKRSIKLDLEDIDQVLTKKELAEIEIPLEEVKSLQQSQEDSYSSDKENQEPPNTESKALSEPIVCL